MVKMNAVTYTFPDADKAVECGTSTMSDREHVNDSGIATSSESVQRQISEESYQRRGVVTCSKEKCTDILKRRIPITNWLPNYKLRYIPQDILAGITVGLTAIPQGIAYAGVAGLPLQYGLYSGIMGCFVYLVLGSCKDVNIGPTAIMALMIRPHVDAMGVDMAVLASFLTGCVVFLLGLLQLGFLVEFISFPVVSAFTTAAALTIGSSQLKGLFGIDGKSNDFLPSWESLFTNLYKARLGDSLLAFGSLIFLIASKVLGNYGSRRYRPEWSRRRNILSRFVWAFSLCRNALIVIFGIILAWSLTEDGETPLKIIGEVGQGLPKIQLPPFSTTFENKTYTFIDMSKQLGPTIMFMPLVAILESIAITKAFAKGRSVDATQELIALGFCNIAGSFIRSMSVTGSFTRTVLNNASGVVTTFGGVFTAITVFLALELLTSTFYYIPKATLSAVIICAMIFMIEIEAVALLWRTKKAELILYFVTLIASLLLGVEYGILIGIATNLLFILQANARPPITMMKSHVGFREVMMVTPVQSLHYPAAEYVRHKIIDNCDKDLDVIIDGQYILTIDMTVAKNIKTLVEDMQIRDQTVILWNFQENVKNCCINLDEKLGKYFVTGNLENIVRKTSTPAIEIQR